MWSNRLRETALSTPAADWFFTEKENLNIEISSEERTGNDATLKSTLRYLLHGKAPVGITKVYGVSTGNDASGGSFGYRVRRAFGRTNPDLDSLLMFVETSDSPENIKAHLEEQFSIPHTDGNLMPNDTEIDCGIASFSDRDIQVKLKYQPNLTYFFGTRFGVYAFTNTDLRITLVVTTYLNPQKYHWLQAVLPMLMPWYWANEGGAVQLEPNVLTLLEKLNSTDSEAYLSILKDFANELDIDNLYNDSKLKGFLTFAQRRSLDAARADVESKRRDVANLLDRIGEYTRAINEKLAYIMGLEMASDDSKAEEFANYIRENKAIKTISFTDSVMRILCNGFFEYYDSDQIESLLDSHRSMIYSNVEDTPLAGNKIEKLMRALFVDGTLRIRVMAEFDINVNESRISAISGASYPAEYKDYLPNPHIEGYSCIDGYRSTMAQYIAEGNFIGAVEQCIASTSTMNFFDSTVTGRLVRDMVGCYDTRKCIMLPDGSFVTIKDAMAYLDAE